MYKLLNIWRKSFFLYKVYILIKVCMIVKVLNAMQDKTFVDFITFNCRNWTVGTIVADKEWIFSLERIDRLKYCQVGEYQSRPTEMGSIPFRQLIPD